MRPIVADGETWSVCVPVSVLVTTVSPAKPDEQIEMFVDEDMVLPVCGLCWRRLCGGGVVLEVGGLLVLECRCGPCGGGHWWMTSGATDDRRGRGRDVADRSTQRRQLHLIGAARLEQSAAQPAEQQAAEVLAELLGEERVEDGVDAAVHVRQRVGEDLERDDYALVGRRVELRTMLRHEHHLPTSIIVTDLYYWAQHDIANTARC